MAYQTSNPPRPVSRSPNGDSPSLWAYTSGDASGAITANGYFSNASNVGMRVGDFIILAEDDNSYQPIIAAVSELANGAATVTVTSAGGGDDGSTGWGSYVDTQYTEVSQFTVAADTDTILPNNKGVALEGQLPTDVTTFYDGSVILGQDGDAIDIMCYFIATPSVQNQYIEIWINIGGTVGPFGDGTLYKETIGFPRGSGVARGVKFDIPSGYTLNTWEANGGTIYVRSNATLTIWGINLNVDRTHKAR